MNEAEFIDGANAVPVVPVGEMGTGTPPGTLKPTQNQEVQPPVPVVPVVPVQKAANPNIEGYLAEEAIEDADDF
jgi:hypothetical protein